jgi:hypothetical protein
MQRDEAIAKAKQHLVPTSLLSAILPDKGPGIAPAEGSFSYDTWDAK